MRTLVRLLPALLCLSFTLLTAATAETELRDRLKALDREVSQNSNDARAYHERGLVQLELGDFRKALQDFDRAIGLEAAPEFLFDRARARESLGEVQQAADDLGKALELNPNYTEAYLRRSQLYQQLGQAGQALQDIQAAGKLGPNALRELSTAAATGKGIDSVLTVCVMPSLDRELYFALVERLQRLPGFRVVERLEESRLVLTIRGRDQDFGDVITSLSGFAGVAGATGLKGSLTGAAADGASRLAGAAVDSGLALAGNLGHGSAGLIDKGLDGVGSVLSGSMYFKAAKGLIGQVYQETKSVGLEMRPAEVESSMGPPAIRINLKDREVWKYSEGVTVIFTGGKVVDIKF